MLKLLPEHEECFLRFSGRYSERAVKNHEIRVIRLNNKLNSCSTEGDEICETHYNPSNPLIPITQLANKQTNEIKQHGFVNEIFKTRLGVEHAMCHHWREKFTEG